MCKPRWYHRFSGHHHGEGCRCGCPCCGGSGCSCGGGVSVKRRYLTSKERKERLEEYRDELKKELQGVEEEIQRI